ncbi:MAG: hypothetical protein IJ009_00295 [Clostridia bacterium]|nr:hypothetical protein [Clostridia bacterium]
MKENFEHSEEKEPRAAEAHGFPCRRCGSQMAYSPAHGKLFCAYCQSEEEIKSEAKEAPEYLYFPEEDAYSAPVWEEYGQVVLTCPSCGADTVMGAAKVTATCPFCGSHYVTEAPKDEKVISPETMIPFRISEPQAHASFAAWVKKQWLAPRKFKKAALAPEMQGMYIPYFTFDASLSTDFSGFGGERRIETYTVRVNGKTQTRTRTRIDWYPVSGHRHLDFDNLPCPATKKVDRALLSKVEPFSLCVLNVYNPAYLAGFFAERYSVGLGEGFTEVRRVMERRMEAHVESTLGYDTYRGMRYDHHYTDVKFKHILLPLWLASYRYHNKTYQFMVNGETGKTAGKFPVSAWKIALLVAGGIALLGLIITGLMSLGGNVTYYY